MAKTGHWCWNGGTKIAAILSPFILAIIMGYISLAQRTTAVETLQPVIITSLEKLSDKVDKILERLPPAPPSP